MGGGAGLGLNWGRVTLCSGMEEIDYVRILGFVWFVLFGLRFEV